MRLPCALTYATKPRLTSIDGALFGPLNVKRLPITRGFVASLRARPAQTPSAFQNGTLATAAPTPARFSSSRRSSVPVVLSSLTSPPFDRPLGSVAMLLDCVQTHKLHA